MPEHKLLAATAQLTKSVLLYVLLLSSFNLTAETKSEPFWQASTGFWASDNIYLDGHYQPKIPRYQTLNAISLEGSKVISEERKFYPPGTFAASALGLDIPSEKGVQLTQIAVGTIDEASSRTDFAPLNTYSRHLHTWLDTVSADTAVMTVADAKTSEVSYKMLITVPTANSRITASLGITGDYNGAAQTIPLRGVSVFSATRVTGEEFEQRTKALQQQYDIGAIVTIDDNGEYQATLVR